MKRLASICSPVAALLLGSAVAIALAVTSSVAFAIPPNPTGTIASAPSGAEGGVARTTEAWRKALLALPVRPAGCYVATFPVVQWRPVACGKAPRYPIIPPNGRATHFVVGNGGSNDFAARPTGTIIGSEGTFVSNTAGLTESGPIANSGPAIANAYTLQINTNQFASTACAGSPNPNCKGWEQFVYVNDNTSHYAFIQYWLIQYNATCPAGWTQFSFSGSSLIYCYQSTTIASLPSGQPVSNLDNVTLAAAVTTTSDQVVVTAGPNSAMRVGVNAVAAAAGWTDAEFNVFGDGGNSSGGGQAGFGANSTLTVRTTVHNGTKLAPTCVAESFTGETNNLTLVGMAPIAIQPAPAIEFTESNIPGAAPACVAAAGVGDTHLTTFGGLLYDFQASGDFVLAQTDDFVVQARQVSGAPNWPNASINKAVAARMGPETVAVCTGPTRLEVNGYPREIRDGQTISLTSGIDVRRVGNVYVAIDPGGNSLRVEDHGVYLNAFVGLGRSPVTVRGILANANGNVNQIQARTGSVLTAPFLFADLYHEYADSWRVPAQASLLSVCGRKVEIGIPSAPMYANNLPPELFKRAHSICVDARVKVPSLLEACTLDVAVIGNEAAAKVFASMPPPVAVGRVVLRKGYYGQ